MSELTNNWNRQSKHRWNLLVSASVIALAAASSQETAKAADGFLASSAEPSFWIEAGGDFEHIDGRLDQWMPPENGVLEGSGAFIRKEPSGSFGLEGKATYQPHQSDWKISISARYGRAQREQAFHRQTQYSLDAGHVPGYGATSRHSEDHMIVDFNVGKDVGLGLFGKTASSEVALGMRIAQFSMTGDDMVSSQPYNLFPQQKLYFHTAHLERRTSALGPSLSIDGSIPLVTGNDNKLSLEWGTLGALLFGRQKVSEQFKSDESRRYGSGPSTKIGFPSVNIERNRNVLIPNLEGSAALSFSLPAARITIGYRADAYWNAVDGGIDAYKSRNQFVYGPFARISVGIGG